MPKRALVIMACYVTNYSNRYAVFQIGKAVPLQGLEWPRVFQEFKVPRFHDNSTGWW